MGQDPPQGEEEAGGVAHGEEREEAAGGGAWGHPGSARVLSAGRRSRISPESRARKLSVRNAVVRWYGGSLEGADEAMENGIVHRLPSTGHVGHTQVITWSATREEHHAHL